MQLFSLTSKQRNVFRNYYLIVGHGMIEFGDCSKVSSENFRAIYVDKGQMKLVTAKDFSKPDAFEFFYYEDGKYVNKSSLPKEVVEILSKNV